jgi:hypothetical protein
MQVARLDIMSVDTPHTAESILYILYDVPAKDQIDRDLQAVEANTAVVRKSPISVMMRRRASRTT